MVFARGDGVERLATTSVARSRPQGAPREAARYVCIGGWALVEIVRRGTRNASEMRLIESL